jgi:NADH dehydrogenase
MTIAKPRVIIVGGGFGGINTAKILGRDARAQVIMIDRQNHHLFQPLLYQVATAGLSPADIATPIRTILSPYKNTRTCLAEVISADLPKKILHTDLMDFTFDYLVLACGAQHSYFGHQDWETFAPGLKNLDQAREIRRRIFLAFEKAEAAYSPEEIRKLLTFVVVGGGPTGVELAGTLGEISRFALHSEFSHIDPRHSKIILVEAGARILASFSPDISKRAMSDLQALGVQVLLESPVTDVNADGVSVKGEPISAATVLWAAGVKPSGIGGTLGVGLDNMGRVMVEPNLSIKDFTNVFAIGDMACCLGEDGRPLPGVASVAIAQGKTVAKNIIADMDGRPRIFFRYHDRGQMATIGRSRAVIEAGKMRFGGFFAWLMWLFVHIYYLIGFRNRLLVMTQWALAFFSHRRGARIIQKDDWRSFKI